MSASPESVQVCHFCLFPLAVKEEEVIIKRQMTELQYFTVIPCALQGYLSDFEEFRNPSHSCQESFVDLQTVFTLTSLHTKKFF